VPSVVLTNPRAETVTVASLPELNHWLRLGYRPSGTVAAAQQAFTGEAAEGTALEVAGVVDVNNPALTAAIVAVTVPAGSLRGTVSEVAEFAPRLEVVPGTLTGGATVKVGTNLTSITSVYWPNTFKAAGKITGALDAWYKLVSTDHDAGAGGIVLLTAPAPIGPWTDRGKVYTDTVLGTQTETPCVVYNPDDPNGKPFYMYYSNAGTGTASGTGVQSTLLAKSATCLAGSWTRVGVVLQAPAVADRVGDGHTGYARVWRTGGAWHARSLQGGSSYSQQAVWTSRDGVAWTIDRRPLAGNVDTVPDPATSKVSLWWPFTWRGQPWAVSTITANGASGGGTVATLAVFRVTEDHRSAIGPVYAYAATADMRGDGVGGVFVGDDGRVYVEWYNNTAGELGLVALGSTGVAPSPVTAPKALPRISSGGVQRLGLVRTERAFDFLGGAVPAGLLYYSAAATGAATFGTTPVPSCTLTTGTANNADARLRLAQDIDVTDLSALWITAEGMVGPAGSPPPNWGLFLSGTNTGIRLWCPSADETASINSQATTPVLVPVYYKVRGVNGSGGAVSIDQRPRNVTILWHIKRQLAYVMEDDQVYGVASTAAAPLGLVRPELYVSNKSTSSVVASFSVEQVKVGWER
jgi:hypothetical protein